jgi:hypothetical protein
MNHKIVFTVFVVAAFALMVAVYARVEQIATDVKKIRMEVDRQGEEFRNVNGFDLNNVPCQVLEAADGVIRCTPRK